MKKKDYVEMRYYDVPQKEWVLALMGKEWIREYGDGIPYLHFHNLFEIGICRQGTGNMIFDQKTIPFRPGMISVIPRNYPHTTNSVPGTRGYWEYLFFDPGLILRYVFRADSLKIRHYLDMISRSYIYEDSGKYPMLRQLTEQIMDEMRGKKKYYVEKVHALMIALVYEIIRISDRGETEVETGRESGTIRNALQYVEEHYMEPVKIGQLADACSISETHFRRLFSESFSISPVEYLNMVRVLHACELMKSTDQPMSIVAVKCGFSTISTFERNFRNVLGVTPYQWKRDPKNYESQLLQVKVSVKKGW